MLFDQAEYDLRCEWGRAGMERLARASDAIVIVDVFSFSTAVDIAVARGAIIYPYEQHDDAARAYAQSVGAELAGTRYGSAGSYSLAPASLQSIPAGTRVVLPSPNGSALSRATGSIPTLTGCLRNAHAVARAAQTFGSRIAVIPAGERWPDGSLRPALEDLLGAGAILAELTGSRSPEAELAIAAFTQFRDELGACLKACGSGRELLEGGWEADIEVAARLNASNCAPLLVAGAYVAHKGPHQTPYNTTML